MKRTLLAVLVAAGALAAAPSFAATGNVVHYGDENNLSWLYVPASAQQFNDYAGDQARQ